MPEPTISQAGGSVTVNLSVTPGSAFNPRSPQFTAASHACKHLLLKAARRLPKGPTITAADENDYLSAAACMRSHGVPDFPDPVFQGNNVTFTSPSPIDTSTSQFKRALATCQRLIPAGLPYSSTGGA